MHKVATIINYSSIDEIFFKTLIEECKKFSLQIIVNYSDKLYDLTSDIPPKLVEGVDYVNYDVEEKGIDIYGTRYLHNLARFKSSLHLNGDIDYVLFLDADEIPEGDRMKEFCQTLSKPSYKIANFFYYKSPEYRAITIHDSSIIIKKDTLAPDMFFSESERGGMVGFDPERESTHDGRPLIHHYSWSKPKDKIQKKINTWGHKDDRDWAVILDTWDDFDETKTDPVLGLNYMKVKPQWQI